MRVTADLYSGRVNPTWTLSAAEAAAAVECLTVAAVAPGPEPEAGLGFRGFVLSDVPSSLAFSDVTVLPTRVLATSRTGHAVALQGCDTLYSQLRQSAAHTIDVADVHEIPEVQR